LFFWPLKTRFQKGGKIKTGNSAQAENGFYIVRATKTGSVQLIRNLPQPKNRFRECGTGFVFRARRQMSIWLKGNKNKTGKRHQRWSKGFWIVRASKTGSAKLIRNRPQLKIKELEIF